MNVDFKFDEHCRPLHYAATAGHADVVQFLISKGADVNAKLFRLSPLHGAVFGGHHGVVDILLQHGADVNAVTIYGMVPLYVAVALRFESISKLLMEKGAVVDINKGTQPSPLLVASNFGHYELVDILVHKSDTESRISALCLAAQTGHLSIVKLLIENIENLECYTKNMPALYYAALRGHADIVNFLISKGFDINTTFRSGFEKNVEFEDRLSKVNSGYFCDRTALHVSYKNKEIVRCLLRNNADIYIKDNTGTTPLQIIIRNDLSNILIEESIPVISAKCDNFSPLQLGAAKGDILFVRYCIQEGCDVNARAPDGFTALYEAAASGHAEVVSYLIDCGADVDVVCRDGITALDGAIIADRQDILSILLEKSEEINAEKERKYLLKAIRVGHNNIVEYLLSKNPDNGDSRPDNNEFPLHDAVARGHLNTVKKLLELKKRKDINFENNDIGTPLQIASSYGYSEITRLLLSNGADPNSPVLLWYGITIFKTLSLSPSMTPPLHIAVENGDSEMIEILINGGADVHLRDARGRTCIELAIKDKNLDVTETLLKFSNMDDILKGHNGGNLLHSAAVSGSLEIIKSLIDEGVSMNGRDSTGAKPVHLAAKAGHLDIVEYFLTEGIDIDDRGLLNFWSLMHFAAAGNQSHICQFLIKKGLGVNITDENGFTPLHVAAQMNKVDVIHYLVHCGAHLDLRNVRNKTPLEVAEDTFQFASSWLSLKVLLALITAVVINDIPKVEALLKEGLKCSEFGYANVKNAKDSSLLHYAAWKGHEEIVDLLLKYNADPNAKEADGRTPLHYAAEFSHLGIVNALLRNGAMFDAECKLNKTPCDHATDPRIITNLSFLEYLFSKIRNRESFIDGLMDLDEAKTVVRAKNSSGRTLTSFAVLNEHTEVESLKSLFQPGFTVLWDEAKRLVKEGRFETSLPQIKVILAKRIDVFGDEDLGVLDIQEVLTKILIILKNYDEAQSLAEKIYKIRKEILGDCNKYTLSAIKLMATVLIHKGRKKEAINLFEDALNKGSIMLGSNNVETIRCQIHFAYLICQEQIEIEILKNTLNLCFKTLGTLQQFSKNTHAILKIKILIAKTIRNLGKSNEALEVLKDAFEIQKREFGLYHSETSDTLFEMGVTLFKLGQLEDSSQTFEEASEIQHRILGPNNAKTVRSRYWLAETLYSQGMDLEALEIYKADMETRISILGANHPDILNIQEKIDSVIFLNMKNVFPSNINVSKITQSFHGLK